MLGQQLPDEMKNELVGWSVRQYLSFEFAVGVVYCLVTHRLTFSSLLCVGCSVNNLLVNNLLALVFGSFDCRIV